MKSVLVLVGGPRSEESLRKRQTQLAAASLGSHITFEFKLVRDVAMWFDSHHDWLLQDFAYLAAGIRAEKEGYDAVCVDTVSDEGVNALRSVLTIPVIGAGKALYLGAPYVRTTDLDCFTLSEHWRGIYEKALVEYALADKCASIRSIDVLPDLADYLTGKEDEVFPQLIDERMRCIDEDGAEVICLGSTSMFQGHASLKAHLPVPVTNSGPVADKVAETVLALGLTHSRPAYPMPKSFRGEVIAAMLDAATEGSSVDSDDDKKA